ncbi:MAG: site-2 protease family protein [Pirellulaceae bacterium]|nr:site-2 protease family protein [Pirellulaceae bacterium]
MFGLPAPSPYDLNFSTFGFPVRVSWSFWLMAAVLGWGWSQSLDQLAMIWQADSPGAGMMLVIWMAAVFLTILVHELGHAVTWRRYGQESHIVLYHFGGMAVNDSFTSWDGARRRRTSAGEQLLVSAMGPAAQLGLAGLLFAIGLAIEMPMQLTVWLNSLGLNLPLGSAPSTIALYGLFDALIWTSVAWAILNLAPIFPLDGGQILLNALVMANVNRPRETACWASVIIGGLLGLLMLTYGQPMVGLMFLMLAVSNWQSLQQGGGLY